MITGCVENKSKQNQHAKSNTELLFSAIEQLPPPPPSATAADTIQLNSFLDNGTQTVINTDALYSLETKDLFQEWASDCKSTSQKYQGKVVSISGKAKWVGIIEYPRTTVISFICGDKDTDIIFCYFTQSQEKTVLNIDENSYITLKGNCACSCYKGTLLEDIRFVDCVLK